MSDSLGYYFRSDGNVFERDDAYIGGMGGDWNGDGTLDMFVGAAKCGDGK